MTLLLLLLILSSENDQTHLVAKAHPRLSIAPVGTGCSQITITAEIKGSESEGWYCPRVEFLRPDGTRSSQESDCPPFTEREEFPRIWRHRVCAPPHPHGMDWTIAVRLYRGDKVIGFADAIFTVR